MGFTLVEMLIAVTIIVIVVFAAVGIFAYTSEMQRKSNLLTQLQQEADFILSILSKEIRAFQIDYCEYGGLEPECQIPNCPADPQSILYLKNGDKIAYQYQGQNLIKKINQQEEQVNRTGILITYLQFYLTPCQDPFRAGIEPEDFPEAPKVLILMKLKPRDFPSPEIEVQQTINQRWGERK